MNIRKIVALFAFALVLAACGGGDNQATATPPSVPAAGTGYPAPPATLTPAPYSAP
jgi:hypothetical protein